jgi:hypothetical protein
VPELWPFPVTAPVAEVLEWRTDVLAAEAAEQRIALRPVPRAILTYSHLLVAAGLGRAGFRSDWLLPLWSMASPVAGNLDAADTNVPVDTSTADFRAPGCAVVAADGGDAQPIEVAAVLDDRLELAAPIGISLRNPLVAPVRRAMLTEPLAIERRRQGLGMVTATFTLLDAIDLAASTYLQHQGLDVLTDPSVLRQPLRETLGQTVEYIDNGFGPIVIEPVRSYLQRRATITLVDYGPAARWRRRCWLRSLRGRQTAFWLPSWGRELVLQAPLHASATSMVVGPSFDLATYLGCHVMFELPSGMICREITAGSFDALGHRLTIAAPGVSILQNTPVHFLTKVRLDADRVELSHTATQTEFSVGVVEVPA